MRSSLGAIVSRGDTLRRECRECGAPVATRLPLYHLLTTSAMQTLSLPRPGAVDEDKATTKALDSVALAVARSKRTVLLVGAGISTNAGIPVRALMALDTQSLRADPSVRPQDFRSPGSGLYSPPSESSSASPRPASTFVTPPSTLKGPALFSASVYSSPDTTAEHLRFVAAFKRSLDTITRNSSSPPSSPRTVQRPVTPTHDFMRLLKKRNKLLRVYTQNIDGLEGVGTGLAPVALAGITPCASSAPGLPAKAKGKGKAKVEGDYVQLHGAVHAVRCTGCDFVRAWSDEDGEAFAGGSVGACPQCEERGSSLSLDARARERLDSQFARTRSLDPPRAWAAHPVFPVARLPPPLHHALQRIATSFLGLDDRVSVAVGPVGFTRPGRHARHGHESAYPWLQEARQGVCAERQEPRRSEGAGQPGGDREQERVEGRL